jgi:hypothetical protein
MDGFERRKEHSKKDIRKASEKHPRNFFPNSASPESVLKTLPVKPVFLKPLYITISATKETW